MHVTPAAMEPLARRAAAHRPGNRAEEINCASSIDFNAARSSLLLPPATCSSGWRQRRQQDTERIGPCDERSCISGIVDTGAAGFLVGVILDSSEPSDPAPSPLTFDYPADFTTLSPLLSQTFLIGDGLNDTNEAVQQFIVPTGATRLFLGFADAYGYQGSPGQYQDNSGSLGVTFQIAAPEPSSLVLLGLGAIGLAACALGRRMRKQAA